MYQYGLNSGLSSIGCPCQHHAEITHRGLWMQEIELRQAALAVARLEAGQRAWLARQQRAWRRGALLHEQVLLLALAGANLELYDAASWRQMAHEVAAYLMGCQTEPVGLL